jgi:putative Mn2+ efflux pump MntP
MIAGLGKLLSLGFFLSLDNFRTSCVLGPLRMRWGRVALVALVFGVWDAIAPLAGLFAGHYLKDAIGVVSDYIGPAALGAYGLFLLVQTYRHWNEESEEMEQSWTIFGLPLPLSVDNFVGGASLGLLGFAPWFSAGVFGAITAIMSFLGLVIGRYIARFLRIHIRYELVTGCALVIEAIVFGLLAVFGVGG